MEWNREASFEIFALMHHALFEFSMAFNNRSVKSNTVPYLRKGQGESRKCTTFSVGCAETVYNHLTMPCNLQA